MRNECERLQRCLARIFESIRDLKALSIEKKIGNGKEMITSTLRKFLLCKYTMAIGIITTEKRKKERERERERDERTNFKTSRGC